MTNINWDQPFYVDPRTLEPTTGTRGALAIPSYGVFGGPGSPDPKSQKPVDTLDAAFRIHDVKSAAATTPEQQGQADLKLVKSILGLNLHTLDPEAALYGGGAALVFTGLLAANPSDGVDFTAEQLVRYEHKAVQDISWGLRHLSPEDVAQAQPYVHDAVAVIGAEFLSAGLQGFGHHLPHHFDLTI